MIIRKFCTFPFVCFGSYIEIYETKNNNFNSQLVANSVRPCKKFFHGLTAKTFSSKGSLPRRLSNALSTTEFYYGYIIPPTSILNVAVWWKTAGYIIVAHK